MNTTTPAVDIYENGDEYLFVADMPGISADAVNIEVEGNELRLAGGDEDARFERSFRLPRGVTGEGAAAQIDNGVLELHVPKPAEARTRRIPIA